MIELLFLINSIRSQPLTLDPVLTERAELRAETLCKTGQFSHAGWQASFAGIPYTAAGENLARGFATNRATHKALVASPTHKANLVKKTYSRVGLAKGKCGVVVQLFAN